MNLLMGASLLALAKSIYYNVMTKICFLLLVPLVIQMHSCEN